MILSKLNDQVFSVQWDPGTSYAMTYYSCSPSFIKNKGNYNQTQCIHNKIYSLDELSMNDKNQLYDSCSSFLNRDTVHNADT